MPQSATRRGLVVRGGWEGHSPQEATERFFRFLHENGFEIEVHEDLAVYEDTHLLAQQDLILQCWTQGEITEERRANLSDAVRAGTGLAGWHGGIVDAFRWSPDYLQMTGGQFTAHPGGFEDYEVEVVPERADHPIVAGLTRWPMHTEKYWVLFDAMNDVLATTTFPVGPDTPWRQDVVAPMVWTRRWGKGRVFVSTMGHFPADLDVPEVRTLTERGLLWASR
jgi:uncharacterized protein